MTQQLTRRQLLRLGLPVTAWPWCGPRLHAGDRQDRKADVLVIGAGFSGLAAAGELARQKYNVLVLEARDRIGGRVWSDRIWDGVTLDLGASWIHGIRGNPIYKLALRHDIKTHPTDSENHWLYRDGAHEYEDQEQDAAELRVKKLLNTLRDRQQSAIATGRPDVSLQTAFDQITAGLALTALQRRELDYELSRAIEQEYAADTRELSYYYWEQEEEFGGGDVLFPKGYGQIARHLAEGLKIKRGHQVRRIEWGERERVAVETSQGRFEADFAVVTLPLGVLQRGSVEFAPALPERKRQAIGRLGMGLLNKAYLRFPRRFWPAKADWIGYVGDPKGRWSEFLNVERFLDQPILLGFNAATYARQLEKKTDDEAAADMLAALRSMFGKQVPDPTDMRITRWASDPFSGGSYSFLKPGSTPQDYEALAEPEAGRLFFAGEHTSPGHSATVHGAYLSGLRAAKQVVAEA